MKKSLSITVGLFAVALLLFSAISADAQWRSKTHDVYEALTGVKITVDGKMKDWSPHASVLETVTGTNGKPFTGIENETDAGDEKSFEEYDGGKWDGPEDHETSIMMVWEPAAFYLGLIVTDEFHENGANDGWNGDACQLAFEMTGERDPGAPLLLYNIALGGNGKLVIHNETPAGAGLVEDDVAIVRDDGAKETYYEARFVPKILDVNKFESGQEFGLSICVNDGDKDAPGQKGWSGWYVQAIVFGKESDNVGLVRLSRDKLAVDPRGKLTTTWGVLKMD